MFFFSSRDTEFFQDQRDKDVTGREKKIVGWIGMRRNKATEVVVVAVDLICLGLKNLQGGRADELPTTSTPQKNSRSKKKFLLTSRATSRRNHIHLKEDQTINVQCTPHAHTYVHTRSNCTKAVNSFWRSKSQPFRLIFCSESK